MAATAPTTATTSRACAAVVDSRAFAAAATPTPTFAAGWLLSRIRACGIVGIARIGNADFARFVTRIRLISNAIVVLIIIALVCGELILRIDAIGAVAVALRSADRTRRAVHTARAASPTTSSAPTSLALAAAIDIARYGDHVVCSAIGDRQRQ